MIDCIRADSGGTWRVTSSMTQVEAAGLLVTGQQFLTADAAKSPVIIDLTAVGEADSSGLAVLLDWLRSARQQGRAMTVRGIPSGLRSLAELYGIEELLGFV